LGKVKKDSVSQGAGYGRTKEIQGGDKHGIILARMAKAGGIRVPILRKREFYKDRKHYRSKRSQAVELK
jgi:hypothetical protein